MNQNKQRYTCVSKPGEYELVGTSSGAGTLKGLPVIVYRDAASGRLFHREPENFMARMKKIPAEQTDINTELLAALEDIIKQSEDASDPYGVWLNSCVENAKAVVAKAKGEHPFDTQFHGKTISELKQDGHLGGDA